MFETMSGDYHPTVEILKEIQELRDCIDVNASSLCYPEQNGAYGSYEDVQAVITNTDQVLMLLLIQRLDNLTKAVQFSSYDPREVE